MMKRVQAISIFIILILVLAIPASAVFQFPSFKNNRPDFPLRFSKDTISDEKSLEIVNLFPSFRFNRADFPLRISKEKISNEEALEIAKSNGVENDPCCPGLTVKSASVKINGVWTTVLSVYGPCGKILYLDPYSGEVLDADLVVACDCLCLC